MGDFTEFYDALIRLDELSLMLGRVLRNTRGGWDDTVTCEGVLEPINQIAMQIGEAIPQSIKATRLSAQQHIALDRLSWSVGNVEQAAE